MNDFFKTMMGQKFYTADVPRLIKALEKIGNELESQNKINARLNKIEERLKIQQFKNLKENNENPNN